MTAEEISRVVIDIIETGKNICRIRKEKKVTVNTICVAMGFSSTRSVHKWQEGKTLPSLDNILRLSILLETSIEEILVINSMMLGSKANSDT